MSKEKTTIIENVRAAQVELPGEVDDEGTVQKDGFKLAPGENDVPVKEWERVKDHHSVKMLLACGILKEKGAGKAKKLTDGLDALEKHEALLRIAKCDSIQILKDWAAKSKDDSLQKKCRSKIDELVKAQGND